MLVVALSQGLGDPRDSEGAVIGVGKVVAVTADLGVALYDEAGVHGVKGVNGVRDFGDSSILAERAVASVGLLPDRSRVRDN